VGTPEVLFDVASYRRGFAQGRAYDVDPDGQRFLMVSNRPVVDLKPQINVVLNWFEELNARVPVQ
jgi:hypothetical protein